MIAYGPWATAALAEAWCIARLGLLNGSLNRYSAMSVIAAIEAFASERPASDTRGERARSGQQLLAAELRKLSPEIGANQGRALLGLRRVLLAPIPSGCVRS